MASYTMPMPGPPIITAVAASNASLVVSFLPPTYVGLGVASYTAATSVGSNAITGTSSPMVLSLPDGAGTAYRVWMCASNAAGPGPYATASAPVTPYTTPMAPTLSAGSVKVNVASNLCTLACTPSAFSAGTPVLQYSLVSTPPGIASTSATPTFAVSLSNVPSSNVAYALQVGASNAAGTSLLSQAVTLTGLACFAPTSYTFAAGGGGALGAINGGDTGGGGAGGVNVSRAGALIVMTAGTANPGVNGGGAGYGGSGFGAGGGGGGLWISMGYDSGGTGCAGCVYILGPGCEYFASASGSYTTPASGTFAMLLVGGGGGGGCKQTAAGHGGGGGGYITTVSVTLSAGTVCTVTIGNGGVSNTDGGTTSVTAAGTTYTAAGGQNGGVTNNGGSGSSGGGGAYQCTIGRTAGLSGGNANVLSTGMGPTAFAAALASVAVGKAYTWWTVR